MKFYVCEHCGNIVTFLNNTGVPVMCCGQKMTEIVPGTTDAAVEKHVPVISVNGSAVTVKVGSVEHPMIPEHFIQWDRPGDQAGPADQAPHSQRQASGCLCPGRGR